MHIAPFHFTVSNEHTDMDFLGYLRYSTSRRNKEKVRVHICTGADMEYVDEYDEKRGYNYHVMFYKWLYETGIAEEIGLPMGDLCEYSNDINAEELDKQLEIVGGSLKFW
jgi:hypothetical protein